VGLGVLVGTFRADQFSGGEIDVVVSLRRAIDAIGPVQAGVEPLRGIGRSHLARQHEAHLVEIGAGVLFGVEVAALPAPVRPSSGQAIENLLGAQFSDDALFFREFSKSRLIRYRSPQPRRNIVFLHALEVGGDAGLAEVFLREDVTGDLRPVGGNFDIVHLEHERAVGISDFARRATEFDLVVGRTPVDRKKPFHTHDFSPSNTQAPSPGQRTTTKASAWFRTSICCGSVQTGRE